MVDGAKLLKRLAPPGKGLQSTGCKPNLTGGGDTCLTEGKEEKETPADEGKADTDGKGVVWMVGFLCGIREEGHLMR